mgnify:CR=1 FL=1
MKIVFYHTPEGRERRLAEAFSQGAKVHGDECVLYGEKYQGVPDPEADVAVLIGVKGRSRLIMDSYKSVGKHVIYLDKGFFRAASHEYIKVSVDDFQPLRYLYDTIRSPSRFEKLVSKFGLEVKQTPRGSGPAVYLGPSQKYARFHRLGDATEYAMEVLKRFRIVSDRTFIYRPKASWNGAVPIPGAEFSRPPRELSSDLKNARLLIVHGSNASADAALAGIPVVALGPAIARPISETNLESSERSETFPESIRFKWACQVAHCQWTIDEFKSGEMWAETRGVCQ